jgi:hypothetical protein
LVPLPNVAGELKEQVVVKLSPGLIVRSSEYERWFSKLKSSS